MPRGVYERKPRLELVREQKRRVTRKVALPFNIAPTATVKQLKALAASAGMELVISLKPKKET